MELQFTTTDMNKRKREGNEEPNEYIALQALTSPRYSQSGGGIKGGPGMGQDPILSFVSWDSVPSNCLPSTPQITRILQIGLCRWKSMWLTVSAYWPTELLPKLPVIHKPKLHWKSYKIYEIKRVNSIT